MLSRVADCLYWMGRYIERAEHTARLIAVKLESMVEQTPEDAAASWARVIEALTGERRGAAQQDAFAITRRLAFDRDNDDFADHLAGAWRATMPARCARRCPTKCGSISTGFICGCRR